MTEAKPDEQTNGRTGCYHEIDDFNERAPPFDGAFELVLVSDSGHPSPDEAMFVHYFNKQIKRLIEIENKNEKNENARITLTDLITARGYFLKELRQAADKFIDRASVFDCLKSTAKGVGGYQQRVEALQQANIPVTVWRAPGFDIDEIRFNTQAIEIDDEQRKLLMEIERALTVLTVVLKVRQSWPAQTMWRVLSARAVVRKISDEISRRNYYVGKLASIARDALAEPKQVSYANSCLEAFKDEFVAREADYVKNRHVWRLGWCAAIWGFVFFSAYWVSRYAPGFHFDEIDPTSFILYKFKNFFVLATGACAGTWLSFVIRRVTLGFTDLALLEDDRLRPNSRILFVVGLTVTIGMLLQTAQIHLVIGNSSVELKSGLSAILIGTLCGISERTLATVVSGRADDFAGRLGARPPPVPVGQAPR